MSNQRAKGILGLLGALTVCGLLAVGAPVAHAVPALQLDIAGGFYDTTDRSIMTTSSTFTLYALLDPTQIPVGDTYYVSVALAPQTSAGADLGSFTFNSTNVAVTSGMTYGVPPLEGLLATFDPGDISPHGTYPTYFREFSFTFNPLNTSSVYNTQNSPGGIGANMGGSGLLYASFAVDRSLLVSPYQLHFDLYSQKIRNEGDIDIRYVAPFSHDAGTTVPEPSLALLMGMGLLGVGLWQRSRVS